MNKNKLEEPPCDFCGSTENDTLYNNVKDYRYDTPEHVFNVVKCTNCGLVFTSPRPVKEYIHEFYNYDQSTSQSGVVSKIRKLKLFLEARQLLSYIPKKSSRLSVLDIGPGTGDFLSCLRDYFGIADITGIEMSGEQVKKAAEINNLQLKQGTAEDFDFPSQRYDLIILRHNLEHQYSPSLILKKIRYTLKKRGILFLKLPNRASGQEHEFNKFWDDYYIPRHLYHFSPSDLKMYFDKYEFEILTTRHEIAPQVFWRSLKNQLKNNSQNNFWVKLFNAFYLFPYEIYNKVKKRGTRVTLIAQKTERNS